MPTYTAYFFTDVDWAECTFKAESPKQALAKARAFDDEHDGELLFQEYDGGIPVNEIEICISGHERRAVWRDDDLTLRLAANDLLEALQGQTEAAQAVVDAWARGDLAGAVNVLEGFIPAARAAIAKAKGGAQ